MSTRDSLKPDLGCLRSVTLWGAERAACPDCADCAEGTDMACSCALNVWVLVPWPDKLPTFFSVGYLRGATRLVS
jgi:hypothetical protein